MFQQGKLHQFALPWEVYEKTADKVFADFMGLVNFLDGTVEALGPSGRVRVRPEIVVAVAVPSWASTGDRVWLAVRPEDLHLAPAGAPGANTGSSRFPYTVRERTYLGNFIDYQVEVAGLPLRSQAPHAAMFDVGASASIHLDADRCAVIWRE